MYLLRVVIEITVKFSYKGTTEGSRWSRDAIDNAILATDEMKTKNFVGGCFVAKKKKKKSTTLRIIIIIDETLPRRIETRKPTMTSKIHLIPNVKASLI